MTTVKHEEYWPAILADPTQYGLIQTADAAWNARAACVYEVLKNTLCARDNAILTQQWETTLELSPADGATLNERKAVILYRLTEAPPLTIALLEKSLNLLMGEGKAVVEHLPAENKLVVHTDRADDTQLEAVTALLERVLPQHVEVERYNHNMEVSWRDLDKYAECVTQDDLSAINPNWKNDLTSDGEWYYRLPKLNHYNELFRDNKKIVRFIADYDTVVWNTTNSNWPRSFNPFRRCTSLVEFRIRSIGFNTMVFFNGCTSLSVYRGDLKRVISLTTCFNECVLDKDSVVHICDTIPDVHNETYTSAGKATLGIHVDHQTDDEVLEAIANAEAKGWTLSIQWNGTPTAQTAVTYGLRKPPIYAKVSEIERPDGTTERYLDWGHYVTDPTGYEEFRSIEAAREHFGLPEEDLTNE